MNRRAGYQNEGQAISKRMQDTRRDIERLKQDVQDLISKGLHAPPVATNTGKARKLISRRPASSEQPTITPQKVRHYNVEDAREFIRKQREKRASQLRIQKQQENNVTAPEDLKRQKLDQLRQRTVQIVRKNVQVKQDNSKFKSEVATAQTTPDRVSSCHENTPRLCQPSYQPKCVVRAVEDMVARETQTSQKRTQLENGLENAQGFPYNFINTVRRKLQGTINSPPVCRVTIERSVQGSIPSLDITPVQRMELQLNTKGLEFRSGSEIESELPSSASDSRVSSATSKDIPDLSSEKHFSSERTQVKQDNMSRDSGSPASIKTALSCPDNSASDPGSVSSQPHYSQNTFHSLQTETAARSFSDADHTQQIILRHGQRKCIEPPLDSTKQIHLKFEAEVHLLNDFNESLKQFMAVERAFEHLKNRNNVTVQHMETQTAPSLLGGSALRLSDSVNCSRGSDFSEEDMNDSFRSTALELNSSTDSVRREREPLNTSACATLHWKPHDYLFHAGLPLQMFEQLIKEEDARIENLKTILNIRKRALLDRTKSELACLEIQRKQCIETGKIDKASLIKKRQRGILLKHEQERNEMRKLKQSKQVAAQERKDVLRHQKYLIKMQLNRHSRNRLSDFVDVEVDCDEPQSNSVMRVNGIRGASKITGRSASGVDSSSKRKGHNVELRTPFGVTNEWCNQLLTSRRQQHFFASDSRRSTRHRISNNQKSHGASSPTHSGPLQVIQSRSETSISKRSSSIGEEIEIRTDTMSCQSVISMVNDDESEHDLNTTTSRQHEQIHETNDECNKNIPQDSNLNDNQTSIDCDKNIQTDQQDCRSVADLEDLKRCLSMKEAALEKRRKEAEQLLEWHRQLLAEEQKIAALEAAAAAAVAEDTQHQHRHATYSQNDTIASAKQPNKCSDQHPDRCCVISKTADPTNNQTTDANVNDLQNAASTSTASRAEYSSDFEEDDDIERNSGTSKNDKSENEQRISNLSRLIDNLSRIEDEIHTVSEDLENNIDRLDSSAANDVASQDEIDTVLSEHIDTDLSNGAAELSTLENLQTDEQKLKLMEDQQGAALVVTSQQSTGSAAQSVDVKKRIQEIMRHDNVDAKRKNSPVQNYYQTAFNQEDENRERVIVRRSNDMFNHEAEQLLRKQLAIEQEIKHLEMQQKADASLSYIREIPNKPPPPYTPPTLVLSTSSCAEKLPPPSPPPLSVSTILPQNVTQLLEMATYCSKVLYKWYVSGRIEESNTKFSLNSFKLVGSTPISKECGEFLFDLCKALAHQHSEAMRIVAPAKEANQPLWLVPALNVKQIAKQRPLDQIAFERFLGTKLKKLFSFGNCSSPQKRQPSSNYSSSAIKWWNVKKKRDHVDEILIKECQEEEWQWCQFKQDELYVKEQLTGDLMKMLLDETGQVFAAITDKKRQRAAS